MTNGAGGSAAAGAVLLATILASSMAFMDGSVVTVALPAIRQGFGAGFAEGQWTANAYTLTLAAFTLLGGAAGDAFGLRRVFMLGTALFGIASAFCGLAWSVEVLIAARAVQGIGGALMVPGSLALISAHYPPAVRGRAIGTWAAASAIAPAIGPVLGGFLVDHGSWRAIFLINLPLAVAVLAVTALRVPGGAARRDAPMDWTGGALAVVGLGLLALGLTRLAEPGGGGALDLAATIGGAAVLSAFILCERRTAHPMMPLALFADRQFAGVNLLTLLLYFALSGALFFLPTALIEAHGYPAALAGSVFLPFVLVMGVLSRYGGGLADKLGPRPVLTVGPIVTGLAFIALAPAVQNGGFLTGIVPVMLLMGLGMGITVAPLSTAVMNAAPASLGGAASGVNNAVARVAGLVAVASLGLAVGIGFSLALGGEAGPAADAVRSAGFGAAPAGADAAATLLRSRATIAGFGAATVICGVLAILAGVVGWLTVRPRSVA